MKKIFMRAFCALAIALIILAIITQGGSLRYIIGISIGLPSFVLIILSRRQLGQSFSVAPEARRLVAKGVYSKIQHPMYLFLDLFLAALILVLAYSILLLPWGILTLVQIYQAQREERMLAAAFGAEYTSYVSRTWF